MKSNASEEIRRKEKELTELKIKVLRFLNATGRRFTEALVGLFQPHSIAATNSFLDELCLTELEKLETGGGEWRFLEEVEAASDLPKKAVFWQDSEGGSHFGVLIRAASGEGAPSCAAGDFVRTNAGDTLPLELLVAWRE